MKHVLFGFLFLSLAASAAPSHKKQLIHILPDAPGSAYLGHYLSTTFEKPSSISAVIQLGERNLAWLKYMNTFREEGKKLQLTKPGDLTGIPIESPKSYNAEIVSADYNKIQSEMPTALKDVLYSGKNFPQNPPVDEATYIEWAKKVDRNYQTAVRWKMMAPWLGQLELRRDEDLRGFYFLSKKTENVESVLRSYNSLPEEKKNQVHQWLEQMCMNTEGTGSDCSGKVDSAVQANHGYEFYLKYLPRSQSIWESYFSLENPRPEISWTKNNPLKMLVPFEDPNDSKIASFLKVNIEDEWKWDQWHLILDLRPSAPVHVDFQPGVVPHVNGAGGDTIVMDNNAPLTEWDVQWTIRHEFGHVLGFVDCYLEFYDPDQKAIVTYQLDIDNIMCARSGKVQQTHYETLKSNYFN